MHTNTYCVPIQFALWYRLQFQYSLHHNTVCISHFELFLRHQCILQQRLGLGLSEFLPAVSRKMDHTSPIHYCHSVTPCHAGPALVHVGLTHNKCSSHKQQHVDELVAPASHPLYASSPQQQLELLGHPGNGTERALLTPPGPTASPPHPTLCSTMDPDCRDALCSLIRTHKHMLASE